MDILKTILESHPNLNVKDVKRLIDWSENNYNFGNNNKALSQEQQHRKDEIILSGTIQMLKARGVI